MKIDSGLGEEPRQSYWDQYSFSTLRLEAPMSKEKRTIRQAFRNAVFERDGRRCVMCGKAEGTLDAHHIEDRHTLPGGGYVLENGITLCSGEHQDNCHWKAEQYHATGTAVPGFSPEELYARIGSDWTRAWEASERLAASEQSNQSS